MTVASLSKKSSESKKDEAREQCKATFFLKKSNMKRCPDLMDFLSTNEMAGSEQYPTTIIDVYKLLLQYSTNQNTQGSNRGRRNHRGSGNDTGVSFFQHSRPPPNLPEPDFRIL